MLSPSIMGYLLLRSINLVPPPYLKHRKHGTASTAPQYRATSSNAIARRSERDNAGKQTELARASLSPRIYTARNVVKTKEEIEMICSAYNNICWCGVIREGFACTLLFLSVLSI